jgi:two-component system sensor histidine kinase YesM
VFQSALQFVNNLRLRTKLALSFYVVVFIPVMAVGLLLTGQLRNMALDNAVEQTLANVERVKQRTMEVINVANDIAYRLANDDRLETVANRRYGTTWEVVAAYRSYPDFEQYVNLYNEISNIRFYMENPTMLNNWEFMQPDEKIKNSWWYRWAMDSFSGTVGWYYLEDERDGRHYLSLVRKVYFPGAKTSGVLVVNVNMDTLGTIVRQESFETMIVDDSGTIVSANRPERTGLTLAGIEFDPQLAEARQGMFEQQIDGEAYRVLVEPLAPNASVNGLRIITIFAVDDITADVDRIQTTALIVILAALALGIMLTYAFSGMLTRRMSRLSKHITKVATGNLSTVMEIDGQDEIGQLARQFNSMVSSIHALVNEVQESNRQRHQLEMKQNEIRLKMLASQINPHFLFNALESIRMKAHLKGEKEIAQIVRLLGKLMRKNLEISRRLARLEDEIDIVRCYLDIQRFRYEERLKYELQIEPGTEFIPVPPLIIQPIVENAVIHGLEGKEEGGTVTLRIVRDGEAALVEVIDDGVGMDEDRLAALTASLGELEGEEQRRIGLRNVHQRLILMYGPSSGLRLESTSGAGTRVSFRLPVGGERLHVQSVGGG